MLTGLTLIFCIIAIILLLTIMYDEVNARKPYSLISSFESRFG